MDGLFYSAAAKNAALHGHWLVPSVNQYHFKEFYEHPPFFIMWIGVLFKLFGISFTVARLSSVVLALILIFKLYREILIREGRQLAHISIIILLLIVAFTKKVRFPLMDVPLTLFISLTMFSYYQAYIKRSWKSWLWVGLYWGLALLSKGLPALMIPAILFFHIVFCDGIKRFIDPKPWVAFLLGITIFSLWPLLLYFDGKLGGFLIWYNKQVIGTFVNARGQEGGSFFTYFLILIKSALPWFLLSLYGIYYSIKNFPRKHFMQLYVCWYLVTLIGLSFTKFKYGHYLLPFFPSMAVLAAFGLKIWSEVITRRFLNTIHLLFIATFILMMAFPIGLKNRRQRDLIHTQELVQAAQIRPDNWISIDNAYALWDFVGYVSFVSDAGTQRRSLDEVMENKAEYLKKKNLFLFRKNKIKNLNHQQQEFIKNNLKLFAKLPEIDVYTNINL